MDKARTNQPTVVGTTLTRRDRAVTPIAVFLLFVYVFGKAVCLGDGRFVNYLLPVAPATSDWGPVRPPPPPPPAPRGQRRIVDLNSPGILTLMRASLLHAVSVSVGATGTPAGLVGSR